MTDEESEALRAWTCLDHEHGACSKAMAVPTHAQLLQEYLRQFCLPGAESRLPNWADWVKRHLGAPVTLGALLTIAGCDDSSSPNDGNQGGTASSTLASSESPSSGGVGISAGTKYGVVFGNGGTEQSRSTKHASGGATGNLPSGGGMTAWTAPTSGGASSQTNTNMGFGGGDKYGVFMSGGASTGTSSGGASGTSTSTSVGTGGSSPRTSTYGAGGSKYGMFMSGGTKSASAGTTSTTATTGTGGSSPISKYGVLMTGGTTTLGNGGTGTHRITSPAADYAVVLLDATEAKPVQEGAQGFPLTAPTQETFACLPSEVPPKPLG